MSVNIKSYNVVFVKNSIKKMNKNYIIWNVKNQPNVKFVMKAKTTTSVKYKNTQIQLKNCADLRLNDNQNCKKIRAWWQKRLWYFIALRIAILTMF